MAKEIVLQAEARPKGGSRESGRVRRSGRIPAVVYGHGTDPKPISVDAKDLRAALKTEAGLNALLNIKLGSENHLALPRELQRDPIRNSVRHIDFLIVNRDEAIVAEVPINLVGEAEGVKRGGGVLEHHLFTLTVKATPDKIPPSIEVDISALNVGDSLRVEQLALPDGVVSEIDGEQPVATVDVPRVVASAEETAAEEAAAAEGEEGAEAAPAAEESAPSEG